MTFLTPKNQKQKTKNNLKNNTLFSDALSFCQVSKKKYSKLSVLESLGDQVVNVFTSKSPESLLVTFHLKWSPTSPLFFQLEGKRKTKRRKKIG